MGTNNKTKNYEIDMTNGPILYKLLVFSLPLIASNILQLLFNAADVVVVGRFAGSEPLAAVGATSSLTNLIVNLFIGLAVGANVVTANYFGAKKNKELSLAVHTSISISVIAGTILAVLGVVLAKPMLSLMDTPPEVINHAVLYMRIYFLGMPIMMVYNFGSSILKAVGDTKRPLWYLALAGVVNVVLNLIFVILLRMGVAGVALATVLSQVIAAALVVRSLMTEDSAIRLCLDRLKIDLGIFKKIAQIGVPSGIQGMLFSMSNVIIQSTVNSFGAVAVAGNTAGQTIEGFVYTSMNAVSQTTVSFVGQNMGAKKFDRMKRVIIECVLLVSVVGIVLGNGAVLGSRFLVGLYSENPEVVAFGMERIKVICTLYLLCGIMEVLVGAIRALGFAMYPTIISLIGACALRIIYIFTLFPYHRSLRNLYLTYPISWFVTTLAQLVCLVLVYRKRKNMV